MTLRKEIEEEIKVQGDKDLNLANRICSLIKERFLSVVDEFYVDCYEDGTYPCDPQYNQVIDEIRNRLIKELT